MTNKPCVFVVEDDDSIRKLLEVALSAKDYRVLCFENAVDALAEMSATLPDAVVMDIMMEGMDGITALKLMRDNARLRTVPVMMLTAKDTEADKVAGLDAGADDYLTKPFGVLELCARVRALLRRSGTPAAGGTLRSNGVELNLATREAMLDGHPLELTNKEFDLLRELMQRAPAAVEREALLQSVWGYDFVGETRTLDMHIGTLRAKLADDSAAPRFIKTVRGVGYRFIGEVETL